MKVLSKNSQASPIDSLIIGDELECHRRTKPARDDTTGIPVSIPIFVKTTRPNPPNFAA